MEELQIDAIRVAVLRGLVSRPELTPLQSARLSPKLPVPETEWTLQTIDPDVFAKESLAVTRKAAAFISKVLRLKNPVDYAEIFVEGRTKASEGTTRRPVIRHEDVKEEVPLLPISRREWVRPSIPPENWKRFGRRWKHGYQNIVDIPRYPAEGFQKMLEEKLGMTQDAAKFLKSISKPDMGAVEKFYEEDLGKWKGRSARKISPPLTPPLRELTPSYFELPPKAEPDNRKQHLEELERSLYEEDELSLPSDDTQLFSRFFPREVTPIIPYRYTHPDEYRLTSPLSPVETEDSKHFLKINIKEERQIPTPPSSSPSRAWNFSNTSLGEPGRNFMRELEQEELKEDDRSLRVEIPKVVPLSATGPVHEVSLFKTGFLKANMGLAAKKLKGEKTFGRYNLRWFPFRLQDCAAPEEESLDGELDRRLVIDEEKGRVAERLYHEMVGHFRLRKEEDNEEIRPARIHRLPALSTQFRAQNDYSRQAVQVPNTPSNQPRTRISPTRQSVGIPQKASSQSRIQPDSSRQPIRTHLQPSNNYETQPDPPRQPIEIRDPPVTVSKSDDELRRLLRERKRKAEAAFPGSEDGDTGKTRATAFSHFLKLRGEHDLAAQQEIASPDPLQKETGTLLTSSPRSDPAPIKHLPPLPLDFTPAVIIPTSNNPTLVTLSRLLSHIIPKPMVVAREFPYPGSTPDLVISPSRAMVFAHERLLLQNRYLPGEKPVPGIESNQLRQRLVELIFSRAYDGVVVLLESDPNISTRGTSVNNFRQWARRTLGADVSIVVATQETMVRELSQILGMYCDAGAVNYMTAEETDDERQMVYENMNPARAMQRLADMKSFLNEEMFND